MDYWILGLSIGSQTAIVWLARPQKSHIDSVTPVPNFNVRKRYTKTASLYSECHLEILLSRASFLGNSVVLPFPHAYACYSPYSRWICMPHFVPLLAPGAISAEKWVNPLHYYSDPDPRPWASSLAFHNVQKRVPQGSTNCKMLFCLVMSVGPACASGGQAIIYSLSKTCKRKNFSFMYSVMLSKKVTSLGNSKSTSSAVQRQTIMLHWHLLAEEWKEVKTTQQNFSY